MTTLFFEFPPLLANVLNPTAPALIPISNHVGIPYFSEVLLMSVIIPTLNEDLFIGDLLRMLVQVPQIEIIVVDGGSEDRTEQIVTTFTNVQWLKAPRGRAKQMNVGAQKASSNVLYFIHADVRPISTFVQEIHTALNRGIDAGCFSYSFYPSSRLLKMNSYLTRFSHQAAGGGDQTLFIRREVFEKLGGFNESLLLMEDFELVKRIKRNYAFTIVPHDVMVSARKYQSNSWIWVQIVNSFIFTAFHTGVPTEKLARWY